MWQTELAGALKEPVELLQRLDLSPEQIPTDVDVEAAFPFRVPLSYVERMRPGDPRDPLLMQVLPLRRERQPATGFGPDPVGDLAAMSVPGVLRKYQGRALLIVTGACPVHCRYCFRRHFPYASGQAARQDWEPALTYLAGDPTITEIILSGGDPLSLSDRRLAGLMARLEAIAHLRRLRVHTRMPVVLPARVDRPLTDWVAASRLHPVFVLHSNHPNEISAEVRRAFGRLADAGATLLNQSVLLRGVNDSARTLAALSESLFESRVLPYYLHQLDRVQGAAHFAVDDARAVSLLHGLRVRLPGYLVPRLVRESPGLAFKLPLEFTAAARLPR